MRMTQVFSPLLIEAQGSVVMIGSLAGEMPYVFGSVYCASKAALHRYTETLRLELKPFGVRVVNVVTGGVKSQIARTFRTLKGDSIYLRVEKDFEKRLTHSQSLGMETDVYARSVVAQLIGWRKKTTIWEGSKSWLVWWLTGYMPRFFLVSLWRNRPASPLLRTTLTFNSQETAMMRMFGLNKLSPADARRKLA